MPKRLFEYLRPSRQILTAIMFLAGVSTHLFSAGAFAAEFTVYKSPSCGCCAKWVDHLRGSGHAVTTKNVENLDAIKKMARVPEPLQSCHTAMVDGYVIEGHVPVKDIERLLSERPEVIGLSVPGMPVGAPGMEGGEPDSYNVILFKADGTTDVHARY